MPDRGVGIFTHIVVPVDGSPEANVAVTQAVLLAGLTGATITLVHAVASSQAIGEGTALVAAIALRHSASDVRIDAIARDGDAASVILEEVRSRGADLVVMRTRGRAGLSRAVLGSVAERMVKHSPVPVWLLPPGVRAASALGVILVPVDSSPGGALALGIARQLTTRSAAGARLRLLQVVVPIPLYLGRDVTLHTPIYIDPSWDELAQEAARGYVTSLASRLRANGVQADGDIVVDGAVPEAIVNAAALYSADLIVMSSEAHTGVTRALLGSVTDAVVRSAACPILVIRRTAEADATPRADEALTAAAAPPASAGT